MIEYLRGLLEPMAYPDGNPFLAHLNYQMEGYPLHWHNAAEIIMPIRGGYDVTVNSKTLYHLRESDILVIPPGTLHEIAAPAEQGERIFLMFELSVFESLQDASNLPTAYNRVRHVEKERSAQLHAELAAALKSILDETIKKDEYCRVNIIAKIFCITVSLYRSRADVQDDGLPENAGSRKEQIEKYNECVSYINRNYREDITLESTARAMGFSKFHFARWFKNFSSISVVEYIKRVRIHKAETMLLQTDMPVTDIAAEAGFCSITTFNRLFKEVTKLTPTEYRKHIRKESERKAEYMECARREERRPLLPPAKNIRNESPNEILINAHFDNGAENWSYHDWAKVTPVSGGIWITQRYSTSSGLMQDVAGKVEPGKSYRAKALLTYTNGADSQQFNICIKYGTNWRGINIMCEGVIKRGECGVIEGVYTIPSDADCSTAVVFIETPYEAEPSRYTLTDYLVSEFSLTPQNI